MTVRDPEVLLELRDEPELLAVADALSEALSTAPLTARRRKRLLPLVLAACLAAGAALLALSLLGGSVRHGVVDRALAAVGDGPVLHAVLREQLPPVFARIEIATGRRVEHSPVRTVEVWFDQERGLKHTITRTDGVVDDELATPEGITTQDGPVWTCARIARHPVEATKAGVSCNLSGDNGTTPRNVPEPRPTGDPGLTGFVDGYQAALASGAARKIGEGTVDGTAVYWLELRLPDFRDAGGVSHPRERVAVSKDTYRPVLVRTIVNGMLGVPERVVSIETTSRDEANFAEPKPLPASEQPDRGWNTVDREPIKLADASDVLGRPALWAGPELGGKNLGAVERREIAIVSGAGKRSRASAVLLLYGATREGRGQSGSIEIAESSRPIDGLTSFEARGATPSGYMTVGPFGWSFLKIGDLYVRISDASLEPVGEDTVLAAARQLRAVSD